MASEVRRPRRAVYTALMGEYEALNEQPIAERSGLPFICLTDSPRLTSTTWQIQLVEAALPADPIRSARQVKIVSPLLDEYDETLWIDNSVVLREAPESILETWLDGSDLTFPLHSFRAKLIDEFEAVVQAGFDDPSRVFEQLRHYLYARPEVLEAAPLWTGMIARRHTRAVADFGRLWFTDVLRYSRRDQLSVLMALDRTKDLAWRSLELDTFTSSLHHWPVTVRRDRSGPLRGTLDATRPMALHVRNLERRDAELTHALRQASADLEAAREQAEALLGVVNHREALVAHLHEELGAAREQADAATQRVAAMEGSRTWRAGRVVAILARPLRALRRPRP